MIITKVKVDIIIECLELKLIPWKLNCDIYDICLPDYWPRFIRLQLNYKFVPRCLYYPVVLLQMASPENRIEITNISMIRHLYCIKYVINYDNIKSSAVSSVRISERIIIAVRARLKNCFPFFFISPVRSAPKNRADRGSPPPRTLISRT